MANLFPGVHTLQRFLTKTDVGPDTHGRNWLLSLESDVKTVNDLLATLPATHMLGGIEAETEYDVYSARRYAETIVFVVLRFNCTFSRLKTLFGESVCLLGRVVKQPSFKGLQEFLLGAKGTKIEEWGTVFSTENAKFSQRKLNEFALQLKINSVSILVNLYSEMSLLFNTRKCSRMNIFVTEKDAEKLIMEHSSNSAAFQSQSRMFSFAKVAIQFKNCRVDDLEYFTTTNLEVLQELCDQFDTSQLGDPQKHQQDFIQFLEDRVGSEELRTNRDEMHFWDHYMNMVTGAYRKQHLLMSGAYRSGKTILASVLLSPFHAPTIDPNKNTDSFWLENAVNQRAVLFDDVVPAGLQELEHMATHLDGGVEVSINRKHVMREQQRFPPGIITTNEKFSKTAYPKLHTRVVEMEIHTSISGNEMIECAERIMRYPGEKKIDALICALHIYYVGTEGSLLTKKRKTKRSSRYSDSPARKEVRLQEEP